MQLLAPASHGAADDGRRTVLIPLGGTGGRVVRVNAIDNIGGPTQENPNPQVIARLVDFKLKTAALKALGAARQLPPRASWLVRAFGRLPVAPHFVLDVANGEATFGLAENNTSSAELGLALVWLMRAAGSADKVVIASGELAVRNGPHNAHSADTAVLPVGEIGSKIDALRETLLEQPAVASGKRVRFFLPIRTTGGDEVRAAHGAALARLEAECAEAGTQIEIHTVATLGEAAGILGIRRLPLRPVERILAGLAIFVALAIASGILHYNWLHAPLDIHFADVVQKGGSTARSPLPVAPRTGSRQLTARQPCHDVQGVALYGIGESIAARVRVREPGRVAGWLGGYHFAVVGISEHSGLRVYSPKAFARDLLDGTALPPQHLQPGAPELSLLIDLSLPVERSKLILVAQRGRPVDIAALRAALGAVLEGLAPAERINAVTAYLTAWAPGYVDHSFRTVERDPTC